MNRSATRGFVLFLAISCVALTNAACESTNNLYPETPTLPTLTTDTFSGTLSQLGVGVHPFSVSVSGSVTITLTAVGPDSTATMGLGIGVWDVPTSTCAPVAWNGGATQGTVLAGTAIAGTFCARVYDVGKFAEDAAVTYTLTVEHP